MGKSLIASLPTTSILLQGAYFHLDSGQYRRKWRHSPQKNVMMINVPSRTVSSLLSSIILSLLPVIVICLPVSSSILCDETCGSMHIPYPFGITPGCGLANYNLTCDSNLNLTLSFKSHSYKVLNFTPNSTIIDPDISNCTTASLSLFDFLPGDTYVASVRNYLMLYACRNPSECPNSCFFDNAFKTQCNMSPSCCYDLHFSENLTLRYENLTKLGCNSYSSWVTSFTPPQNDGQATTLLAMPGLELEWALPGSCTSSSCGENAKCLTGTAVPGHTCACDDQFTGNPYSGCHPAILCNTMSTTNECGCWNGQITRKDGCLPNMVVSHRALMIASIVAGGIVSAALVL